ncbi:MAG: DUF1990 domain-containing protein [Acidobacteriota bacterium]
MFLSQKPSQEQIQLFLSHQRTLPFSYPEVGYSANTAPASYNVDHNRIKLGEGEKVFTQAVAAIKSWQMFNLGWVELLWPNAPIEVGTAVGVLIKHFGFWSLNACRIVYVITEANDLVKRFGFAYGTLPEHGEKGEERFSVEIRNNDNSVWYDIYAFSKPNKFLAKLGYPLTRILQKRFARDSKQAMFNATTR